MFSRRPVLREHVLPLIRLTVRPDQIDLVSSNAKTLAEAAYETGSHVWGLWDRENLVGLMAMVHPDECPWDEDYPLQKQGDRRTAAYLWRLMIGADFQGKGYGAAALAEAFTQARSWGYAKITAHVSYAPHSNLPFYERYGFQSTGVIDNEELIIVADI